MALVLKDNHEIAEVTLDNISSLGGLQVLIDPKIFLCSICYCINPDCQQCKNPKCLKLFCHKCYDKSKKVQPLCPFCRINLDYRKADYTLSDIIDGLKYYCSKSLQCNGHYSLSEYTVNHYKRFNGNDPHKENMIKCMVCHYRLDKTPNWLMCMICNKKGCSWNIDVVPKEFSSGLKNIESCMKKCFICKGAICSICLKQYPHKKGLNFICEFCPASCFNCYSNEEVNSICDFCHKILCSKCVSSCDMCAFVFCKNRECYSSKIPTCNSCTASNSNINYYKCLHMTIFDCENCYQKCQRCFRRTAIINCNSCTKPLCGINCGVKCKDCKGINCASCMSMCSICKKVTCMQCKKFCWNCSQESSIITCQECNSDTIRKCQYAQCPKYLCINCWNVCNYCTTIFCNEHTLTCINCEDTMCNEHYSQCSLCSKGKDSDYKKLCLKKCTMKCAFCTNTTNAYCIEKNHKGSMVDNYNCEHNVCGNCVKKCRKCQQIVVTCPKCIVNYYFIHCKFCEEYLCSNCAGHCGKCEDDYCIMGHLCWGCGKVVKKEECVQCEMRKRMKCKVCEKALSQCVDCGKRYFCSEKCYYELRLKEGNDQGILKRKMRHLCDMFICKEHYDENNKEKKINSDTAKEKEINSDTPKDNRGKNDFCLFDDDYNNVNNKDTIQQKRDKSLSKILVNSQHTKK